MLPGFSKVSITGGPSVPTRSFQAADLRIRPFAPKAGDIVKVSFNVTNISETDSVYPGNLWIDGTIKTSAAVNLAARTSIDMSFEIAMDQGNYDVRIDELLGEFKVGPAAVKTTKVVEKVVTTPVAVKVTVSTPVAVPAEKTPVPAPKATMVPPTAVPAPTMVPATPTEVPPTPEPVPTARSVPEEPTPTPIPAAEPSPTPVPEVIVDESGGISMAIIAVIVIVVLIVVGGAGFVLTRRKDT